MRIGDIVVRKDAPAHAGRVTALLPGFPLRARVRWAGVGRVADEPILSLAVVIRETNVFRRMQHPARFRMPPHLSRSWYLAAELVGAAA